MSSDSVNYEQEINSFYDWLETNPLATTIMKIKEKAGWLDKFAVALGMVTEKVNRKYNR